MYLLNYCAGHDVENVGHTTQYYIYILLVNHIFTKWKILYYFGKIDYLHLLLRFSIHLEKTVKCTCVKSDITNYTKNKLWDQSFDFNSIIIILILIIKWKIMEINDWSDKWKVEICIKLQLQIINLIKITILIKLEE